MILSFAGHFLSALVLIFEFKKMNITLFITENCSTCLIVQKKLRRMLSKRSDVSLLVENIRSIKSRGIVIVPAIFIGDELFSYGEFEEKKFLKFIEQKSSTK